MATSNASVRTMRASLTLAAVVFLAGSPGTAVQNTIQQGALRLDSDEAAGQIREVARRLVDRGNTIKLPVVAAKPAKITRALVKADAVHDLPGGGSRALLIELPQAAEAYDLTITSMCNCGGPAKSVFVPVVVFFDEAFGRTRVLDERDFAAKNATLRAIVIVEHLPALERYALLFTTGDLVEREMATLQSREGLLTKLSFPLFRAAFGSFELVLAARSSR